MNENQTSFEYKGKVYVHDKGIYCVQFEPEHFILNAPYHFDDIEIPEGFEWNGASSPNIPLIRFIAPKFYKNVIASCIHDYKCGLAKNSAERKEADGTYWLAKRFIERDTSVKCDISWAGVRVGAFFGIGSSF
jgi:hypothetical protein